MGGVARIPMILGSSPQVHGDKRSPKNKLPEVVVFVLFSPFYRFKTWNKTELNIVLTDDFPGKRTNNYILYPLKFPMVGVDD